MHDAPEFLERSVFALERRVLVLERAIAALAEQVTTRCLVVVDACGVPRVVAEVARGTAELRVTLSGGRSGAEAVLYAGAPDLPGAADAVGLQLRAGGDAVFELDASRAAGERWRVTSHTAPVSAAPAPLRPPRTAGPSRPAVPGPSGSPG